MSNEMAFSRFMQAVFVLAILNLVNSLERVSDSNRRICWQCMNARSDEHCFISGKWRLCEKNEFCHIEQRKENGIEVHSRGCKQDASCDSLITQNQLSCMESVVNQHMKKFPTSPMRCQHCCFEDYCNPTKAMKDTMEHLNSIQNKKERSMFLKQHQASMVKSLGGRKPNTDEIYYPYLGWIQWSKGALQSGLALPPFKNVSFVTKHPILNDYAKKSTDCPSRNLLQKPSFIKIREECTMLPPTSCVIDGTFALRIEKYRPGMKGANNDRRRAQTPCARTPAVDTMMVYDEGDHYILINRINHRATSNLPFKRLAKFYVGNAVLTDFYTHDTIKSFRRGLG